MNRRAFVIVLDACGAGELPDAADYGDAGANTLGHVAEAAGGLDLPVLGRARARLRSCRSSASRPPPEPVVHGRLHPLGPGKDTITGHWELMGVDHAGAAAHLPRRLPATRSSSSCIDATGRGVLLQPALQRHRGDRRLRRAAPARPAT